MKVYLNRRPIRGPWGGGAHFINAFHKFASKDNVELLVDESMSINPSAILLAGIDNDGYGISAEQAIMYKDMMSSAYNRDVKLVLRVNENDARKGTSHVDPMLLKIFPHMDGVVFVSHWLKEYFEERGWRGQNDTVIVNGVDRDVFKPQPKLNNGKINLLMSHWSDNYMKGQDYAEWLDSFVGKHSDEFTFTFIGRIKANFKHSTHVKPLSGKRLGEEIGKYDVCINASRFDPGPNSVIEPISCELPTYVHVDGGGGVEFAGADHTFSSFDELECLLLKKQFTSNTTSFLPWNQSIKLYAEFLALVCGKSIV